MPLQLGSSCADVKCQILQNTTTRWEFPKNRPNGNRKSFDPKIDPRTVWITEEQTWNMLWIFIASHASTSTPSRLFSLFGRQKNVKSIELSPTDVRWERRQGRREWPWESADQELCMWHAEKSHMASSTSTELRIDCPIPLQGQQQKKLKAEIIQPTERNSSFFIWIVMFTKHIKQKSRHKFWYKSSLCPGQRIFASLV